MKFHVPDMSCGHCTAAITKSLQTADKDAVVRTDLTAREVSVNTKLGADTVISVLKGAGYTATPR